MLSEMRLRNGRLTQRFLYCGTIAEAAECYFPLKSRELRNSFDRRSNNIHNIYHQKKNTHTLTISSHIVEGNWDRASAYYTLYVDYMVLTCANSIWSIVYVSKATDAQTHIISWWNCVWDEWVCVWGQQQNSHGFNLMGAGAGRSLCVVVPIRPSVRQTNGLYKL